MKPIIAFVFNLYGSAGASLDCIGAFDTVEAAQAAADGGEILDILDVRTGMWSKYDRNYDKWVLRQSWPIRTS